MKLKARIIVLTGMLCLLISACGSMGEKPDPDYTFERLPLEQEDHIIGTSHICAIYDQMDLNGMTDAIAFGQLQCLYGEPDYKTDDYENMYCYQIKATYKDGSTYYLTAYCGPTGPAIGGDSLDEGACKAGEALAKYIRAAGVVDYEHKCIYYDFGTEITMGIKDGKPYYSEN